MSTATSETAQRGQDHREHGLHGRRGRRSRLSTIGHKLGLRVVAFCLYRGGMKLIVLSASTSEHRG